MNDEETGLIPSGQTGEMTAQAPEDIESQLPNEEAVAFARAIFAKADALHAVAGGAEYVDDGGYFMKDLSYTEDGAMKYTVAVSILREAGMIRKRLHFSLQGDEQGAFRPPDSVDAFPFMAQVDLVDYEDPSGSTVGERALKEDGKPDPTANFAGQFWNKEVAQKAPNGDGRYRPRFGTSKLSAVVIGAGLDTLTHRATEVKKLQAPSAAK